jgi:hypothetical protein
MEGVKIACPLSPVDEIEKSEGLAGWPLKIQENVRLSESGFPATAEKVVLPPTPMVLPELAGVWLPQVGALFRVTDQVRVALVKPSVTMA